MGYLRNTGKIFLIILVCFCLGAREAEPVFGADPVYSYGKDQGGDHGKGPPDGTPGDPPPFIPEPSTYVFLFCIVLAIVCREVHLSKFKKDV